MKTRKPGYYILLVNILLIILYVAFGQLFFNKEITVQEEDYVSFTSGWWEILENNTITAVKENNPLYAREHQLSDGSIVNEIWIENKLPQVRLDGKVFMMWNKEWILHIYIDDELRYTFPNNQYSLLEENAGSQYIWFQIDHNDEGKYIRIQMEPLYPKKVFIQRIYLANESGIYQIGLIPNLVEIITSFFLILLGVISFVIAVTIERSYEHEVNLKFFCLGALLIAVWMLLNTAGRQFIFHNVTTLRDGAFLVISILPIPFYFYMDRLQNRRYSKMFRTEFTMNWGVFLCMLILQLTNLKSIRETAHCSQLVCAIGAFSICVSVLLDLIRGYLKEYLIVGLGILLLAALSIVHITNYLFSRASYLQTQYVQLSLLFCVFVSIYSMTNQLNKLQVEKKKAEYASKAKGDFLANMSHEIRTPINAVLGMDELILRESSEPSTIEYANQIKTAGNTLLSLINDILDFSKIENGKLDIIDVDYDIGVLIMSLYLMAKDRADKKGLTLHIEVSKDLPSILHGDDVRIKQIITNILTNAVKYTHVGTVMLKIDFDWIDEENIILHVSVKDSGIGIKEEDMDKLFTAFQRVDEKKNRNIEGTGLGLQITQKLLMLMESSLKVESEYGKGSTFFFDLKQKVINPKPIGELDGHYREMNRKASEYKPLFEAPDLRVLVIDDNKVNLAVFKGLLKKTKIQITTALSGKEALGYVKDNQYDIIFVDHMMPEMDGIETFHAMQKMENNASRDAYMVMLTANAISGARQMYLDEGFQDFLEKPIKAEALEKLIRDRLEDVIQE